MARYLEQEGINLRIPRTLQHCGMIERLNRTLQSLIFKDCSERNSFRYIDRLDLIVGTYLNRKHSTIKMSPLEAEDSGSAFRLLDQFERRYLKLKKD